ncbi:MAG: phospholipase D-like domain-containing protein [Chloroflexota bacterium]|nr:phospholipase D-like domain-containing protein [Chloroflexota bacterium]
MTDSLPFVIDNQEHTMSEVLQTLLAQPQMRSLDIATAYFNVGAWSLLHTGLKRMGTVRLLLGDEPEVGTDIGLREAGAKPVKGLIRELADASFNERMLRQVEGLIAFLRQDRVQVRLYTRSFLHAKSYQFYADGGFTRIAPLAAIVGSSNFTRAGLLSNQELNFVHRANFAAAEVALERIRGIMEESDREQLFELHEAQRLLAADVPGLLALTELTQWYRRQWQGARDFKDDLIELINASKFGRKEYTPYQVYTKALFEYFRDELATDESAAATRSAVELSEFQEDAVKKARKILARYDGVLIADSVGLGKTWIGKKLLEDYAYHLRYKAVIICPAALHKLWHDELLSAGIAARIVTQEALGREEFDSEEIQDADILLIDESHNFRNHNAQRYENLERILAANNRRGRLSNERKKLILLTATPINNSIFDLYNQVNLFTGGDRSFFAAAGIGDLQRYFMAARRAQRQQETSVALFNLLEEVVIRRTRPFIKQAYPDATIKGQPIHWPERRLRTIRYNLEATYSGIYADIVKRIEGLRLAPYRLETYKKQGIERDQFEAGREEALVGIFKSRYLKRFESSIEAFRISVRRALEFLETFESYILARKVLDSTSFQRALRFLAREDEEDDATALPASRSDELDLSQEARRFLDTLPALDAEQYDLKRLRADIRKDVEALRAIWTSISAIMPANDAKLNRLKDLLAGELRGQKVLVFTYYKDTARYLYKQLCGDDEAAEQWHKQAGEPHIRRMDSGADAKERARLVAHFAPRANNREEIVGSENEVAVLISTDVLSEGQNLQDCGVLINYDLHWNPTRMVQRAGRIDRIGTRFATLWVMNMFPDDGLESLLGLVESLSQKIAAIDRSGLLDASILGEVVHPQNFNTLRRIEEEDGKVLEEQEQFAELASSEFLLQNLKNLLNTNLRQSLEELPDGIHSGLLRQGAKGIFFYFTVQPGPRRPATKGELSGASKREHYWRYVDLAEHPKGGRIEDNRYIITNLIQCQPDALRYVPAEGECNIFELQEQVITSIIQSSAAQIAVEEVPTVLDPIQQTLALILRRHLNDPAVARADIVAALQRINTPQPRVYLKALRKAYEAFQANRQIQQLVNAVQNIGNRGASQEAEIAKKALLKREDLKLICFEYVWQ